jgi:hypothetical protein
MDIIETTEAHRKTAQVLCDKVNEYLVADGHEPISIVPEILEVAVGRGEIYPDTRTWYRLSDNTSMPYGIWVAETVKEPGFITSESIQGEWD